MELINKLIADYPLTIDDEILRAFDDSRRTAIVRSKVSAPLNYIINSNYFNGGSVLHYGKGKANLDSEALSTVCDFVAEYDYYYCRKEEVLSRSFDYVYIGYVLNTLIIKARKYVIAQVANSTKGIAFFAVRTDKRGINGVPYEDGVITSIKTFQKAYLKGELSTELSEYFKFVKEIKYTAGYSIVACSNNLEQMNIHFSQRT